MVDKYLRIPALTLKHKGPIDFQQLLDAITGWLSSKLFFVEINKTKYKGPKGHTEREFEISGVKKINDYVKQKIEITIFAADMKEVDVVKNGETKKLLDGLYLISVEGYAELDYTNRFEKNNFLKMLRNFYHNFIIFKTTDEIYEDEIKVKVGELFRVIRNTMEQTAVW